MDAPVRPPLPPALEPASPALEPASPALEPASPADSRAAGALPTRRELWAEPRAKRPHWTKVSVLTALLALAGTWVFLLAGLVWWSNAPMLVGWRPRVVLTGSMQPSLAPGDVILVQRVEDPAGLPPGRVIVVQDESREGGSYVHRIVRRDDDDQIITKGDANQSEDHPAVTDDRVMGQVRLVVPAIGMPLIWLRGGQPALVVGFVVVTWASLAYVLHAGRNPDAGRRSAGRRRGQRGEPTGVFAWDAGPAQPAGPAQGPASSQGSAQAPPTL